MEVCFKDILRLVSFLISFMELDILQLNDSVKDEIIANQRMIPPGKSLLALNGAIVNIEAVDLYL